MACYQTSTPHAAYSRMHPMHQWNGNACFLFFWQKRVGTNYCMSGTGTRFQHMMLKPINFTTLSLVTGTDSFLRIFVFICWKVFACTCTPYRASNSERRRCGRFCHILQNLLIARVFILVFLCHVCSHHRHHLFIDIITSKTSLAKVRPSPRIEP